MLSASNRLKKQKDISNVFKNGRRYYHDWWTMRIVPNETKVTRFAWMISNKVSRKAVVRNRLRRQLKAIMYHLLPHISPGYDFVISVKPNILNYSFEEIDAEMLKFLKKIKYYQEI